MTAGIDSICTRSMLYSREGREGKQRLLLVVGMFVLQGLESYQNTVHMGERVQTIIDGSRYVGHLLDSVKSHRIQDSCFIVVNCGRG